MRLSACDLGSRTGGPSLAQPPPHTVSAPQESISDFYWYYSGKDVIEEQGKRNFSKAMSVAKQVFNSLTEYIQVGPACWGRAGQSRIARGAWLSRCALLPHPHPTGPLHWEPAELGAQPPLGRRGGIPARVCPHDDEARSGSGTSVLHLAASGHPQPARFQVLPYPPFSHQNAPGVFQTSSLAQA